MENVDNINEESITDFLVWKWRELDHRFNYLRITPYNHYAENATTGADFDLELWLVGKTHHISLAVQAKKFIRRTDSYVRRLRYPNGTKAQMDKLISYAKSTGKQPFYFIYSLPELSTKSMCRNQDHTDCAVFMGDAIRMEEFASGRFGKRITRDQLLQACNPFHCAFCCPLGMTGRYLQHYFPSNGDERTTPNENLPVYVNRLLESRHGIASSRDAEDVKIENGFESFRTVGVYDMRNEA